jgi:glycosyltransferase involved in cell wall biosynthesis
MMRLGLVIYGSLNTFSGGYLYDRKLVEHLRRAGDEVEIVSLPQRSYAQHLADNASAWLSARLRAGRWDALLQDELNHPSLFWINRRVRGRWPIVAIVHHLRSSERHPAGQRVLYRWIERRYLAGVDGFVFNSQTTRAAVEALSGGGRRAVVAHPGGDRFGPALPADHVRARAYQPGPLRLLFVGNVIPRKGLHTLVEGLRRLEVGDWRLEVAGSLHVDPDYARAVREQIERRGLGDKVALCGAVTDEALREMLTRAHVLVVPSSYEGFGIVYLEGMGFGLPAIAAGAGAAGEIITEGENGFLVPPGDAGALAESLKIFLRNRERLAAMSLAALRRFQQHPAWESTAVRIRAFLQLLTGH